MKDEQKNRDRELEQEIRSQRKFSMAEAIGRSGGGLMKGGSPVARLHQVQFECKHLLEEHLSDSEGALKLILHRRIENAELLFSDYLDDAAGGLLAILSSILRNEITLADFVRDVDVKWGRLYGERPRFDIPGEPPAKDDPYTLDGVKETLEELREAITRG